LKKRRKDAATSNETAIMRYLFLFITTLLSK